MALANVHAFSLVCHVLLLSLFTSARAAGEDKPEAKASYAHGDAIPVSCLNRTT